MAESDIIRPKKNPYVGPPAFQYGQTLYGRSKEVTELLDTLIVERIVLLYSPSGAGKSSLINAALIEALENRRFTVLPVIRVGKEVNERWLDATGFNRYLLSALISIDSNVPEERRLDLKELASMSFSDYMDRHFDKSEGVNKKILIFDQFEEILTKDPTDQPDKTEFFSQVGSLLEQHDYWALFSMREEHYAGLEPYAHLVPTGLSTTYRLDLLSQSGARQAIQYPAGEGVFDDLAVDHLVDDLRTVKVRTADGEVEGRKGSYIEPLALQVVCEGLWDSVPSSAKKITRDDLIEFGDVNSSLRSYYENAIRATNRATGVKENSLRRWFEEYLITPGGTRGIAYRDKDFTGRGDGGIPNAAVDELERRHLIRAETRSGGELWYELTHDRFIQPIQEANRGLREYELRRKHRRKLFSALWIFSPIIAIFAVLGVNWIQEQQRTVWAIGELLELRDDRGEFLEGELDNDIANISSYLWHQDTSGSLKILAEQLERAQDLISEDYQSDPQVPLAMLTQSIDSAGPLIVEINPNRQLNEGKVQFSWRSMARSLALDWGVPVPMTIGIKSDSSLDVDNIAVSTDCIDDQDCQSQSVSSEISIPYLPGFAVVSENQMPDRLVSWFEGRKGGWTTVDALTYNGPWWLVPKWTAPLFKVAEHPTSPRESLIAVAAANEVLERPELGLNRENLIYLLETLRLVKASDPDSEDERVESGTTIHEALLARGGIDVLVNDLREVIRLDYPLTRLVYLLDALSSFPYPDFDSYDAAYLAVNAQSDVHAPILDILTGARESPVAPSEAHVLSGEAQAPYEETMRLMGHVEPPIRAYVGRELVSELFTEDGLLKPEFKYALSELRGDIYKEFGVRPPGIMFREGETWKPIVLGGNEFQLEILNQTETSDLQTVTTDTNKKALTTILRELRWTYSLMREWWIDTEYVHRAIGNVSDKQSEWLLANYSLTDIKSLLRAVVFVRNDELDAYDAYAEGDESDVGLSAGIGKATAGGTIRDLNWLLKSLVFWGGTNAQRDTALLSARLRELQEVAQHVDWGLAHDSHTSPASDVGQHIRDGISELQQDDFDRAEQHFTSAIELDEQRAIESFLVLYSRQSEISPVGKLERLLNDCSPPLTPAQLEQELSVGLETRYEVEQLLVSMEHALSESDRKDLKYCLLEHYFAWGFHSKAEELLIQFFGAAGPYTFSPGQWYGLAYWALELHGESVREPDSFPSIESSLTNAFQGWQDDAIAEKAFESLTGRYGAGTKPAWYLSLLEIGAESKPENAYIALILGMEYAEGRSVQQGDNALYWLSRASEKFDKFDPDIKAIYAAWTQYYSAKAILTKTYYSQSPIRQELAQEAVQLLTELINDLKSSDRIDEADWPGAESYMDLVSAYELVGSEQQILGTLIEASDSVGESLFLQQQWLKYHLVAGDTDAVGLLAREIAEGESVDPDSQKFLSALGRILIDDTEAASTAREFLFTEHAYVDYVRLILFWRLTKQGKQDQARALIQERWRRIDPDSWDQRLDEGDAFVWREKLIGYYVGEVERGEIFGSLKSREVFEKSAMSRIGVDGLSYSGMRAEAFFYDALLQDITGDIASRRQRYEERLREVLKTERNLFEYAAASYLASQIAGQP